MRDRRRPVDDVVHSVAGAERQSGDAGSTEKSCGEQEEGPRHNVDRSAAGHPFDVIRETTNPSPVAQAR